MLYNFKTSKQYLENLEKGWIKDKLEEVRNIILKYGPELEEAIEYKMLCYRLKEKTVFHLNAQKSYVSLYVGSIDKIQEGRHLLQNFNLGKGCIRVKKNNTINNSGLEDFIEKPLFYIGTERMPIAKLSQHNMKLFRIILPVDDIEKATDFYSTVFNINGIRVSPGRHYFNLQETVLACYDPKADGDVVGIKWKFQENQCLYISVDNIERIFDRLQNIEGVELESIIDIMPWGERLFYARDLFGNPICFVDEKTVFTGT